MADEDEIDILGDFSLSNFTSQSETNMLDNTPLVSQNSDLLNCDYTIHPQWLLDKPSANPDNWYETNSAASTSEVFEADTLGHISTENYITDESGWTEKEKNLLHRGIEIFGKSSVRLSQFVGSKTASEVKYYLKNFFSENQNFYHHVTSDALSRDIPSSIVVTEVLDANQIPASIEEVIAVVSTGSPTVTSTLNKQFGRKSFSSTANINAKDTLPRRRYFKTNNIKTRLIENSDVTKTQIKFNLTKSQLGQKRDKKMFKFNFKTKFKMDIKKRGPKKQKGENILGKTIQSTKCSFGNAEITTGKGLSVPICDGEEIVKIEHVEDNSSDISVDIEDVGEISSSTAVLDKAEISNEFTNNTSQPSTRLEKPLTDVKLITDIPTSGSEVNSEKCIDLSLIDKNLADQLTTLDKATSELNLDKNKITDLEKLIHYEFFEGRSLKTPERYLKIRNHIINSWQSSKPNYITKTSVRLGLKNCGDVTCISRIHYFLEQIGAINFGCDQTKYDRPLYNTILTSNSQKHKPVKTGKNLVSREPTDLGPRQRIKKFTHDGEGGCTLVHGEQGEVINTTIINEEPAKQKLYIRKPSIRLIYCRPFTDTKPQEYAVRLSLSTLLLMDFHAHTYMTEVMGLVGGYWDFESKSLTIACYEPCKNIASSATHCDMCPISQAKAAESIHNKSLQILGWFHSHPTFAPEPSQQDLDTQKLVQQWIGHKNPCIGVILTPFSFNGALISSPFRCLIVDKKPNFDDQVVPYRFKVDIIENYFNLANFLKDMKIILFSEEGYLKDKRIHFHEPYFQDLTISHLDKFISSVNMHLAKTGVLDKTTCDHIITGIKDLLLTRQ